MKTREFSRIFINKEGFLKACADWRHFPPKPAVYILIIEEPFMWGDKETDIIYIGSTKHLGGIDSNCRLWDYHTKATQHEKNIIEKIKELEKSGKAVKILWSYRFPNNYTHKEYEKVLLQRFKEEHGKPPKLNKI